MGGEEVVAPEIEVIGAEGEIKAGGRLEVVVKLPGMHGTNHGGQRSTLRQGDVVAQVLVVGIGVVASAIAHPPRVAAPEKAVVGRDGTIEIESRGEIGEVHTVVEVERRNDLATHIEPLAEGQAAPAKSSDGNNEEEGGSGLHLMNQAAMVFGCVDPVKTALFYETKLGFKAAHLDDEKMPHIRLVRDNIVIALVKSPVRMALPSMYDLIIYVTEPLLLYHEVKANGVKIIEELPDARESEKAKTNRQFVIEDNDGRKICISQSTEIV